MDSLLDRVAREVLGQEGANMANAVASVSHPDHGLALGQSCQRGLGAGGSEHGQCCCLGVASRPWTRSWTELPERSWGRRERTWPMLLPRCRIQTMDSLLDRVAREVLGQEGANMA